MRKKKDVNVRKSVVWKIFALLLLLPAVVNFGFLLTMETPTGLNRTSPGHYEADPRIAEYNKKSSELIGRISGDIIAGYIIYYAVAWVWSKVGQPEGTVPSYMNLNIHD